MPIDDQRERGFDTLLRQTLRDETTSSSSACVDAETLAAWSAGALLADEARQVERHAAGCERCQTMMAAFARAEVMPEPAAPSVPLWKRWRLQWLVPIAATATGLAVWVATPDRVARRESPLPASEVAQTGASQPATVSAPNSAPVPAEPPAPATPPAFAPALVPAPAPTPGQERTRPAAPPPPATSASAPPAPAGKEEEDARREAAKAAGPSRDAAAPSAADAPASSAQGAIAALARTRANLAESGLVIAAANAASRWRVTGGGLVEVSTTSGAQWVPAVIVRSGGRASPLAIVGGAAPDGRTCWLVGRGGLVLLTTDGTTFREIAFPERADLTSVLAASASEATIMTADGRTFATADGGVSWASR